MQTCFKTTATCLILLYLTMVSAEAENLYNKDGLTLDFDFEAAAFYTNLVRCLSMKICLTSLWDVRRFWLAVALS